MLCCLDSRVILNYDDERKRCLLRKLNSVALDSRQSLASLHVSTLIILFGSMLLCTIWVGLYFKVQIDPLASYDWVAGVSTSVIIISAMILLMITARQRQTIQALQQARVGLEVEVEQRNQQLFGANDKLIGVNKVLQYSNVELADGIADRDRNEIILKTSQEQLVLRNAQLATTLQEIKGVQTSLVQQEKLAAIGQLAAGVAHEINNPLSFVTSNVETLEQYFNAFNFVFAQYRELRWDSIIAKEPQIIAKLDEIFRLEKENDLEYISADIPDLFRETSEGLSRMNKIVKGMGIFTRMEQQVVELYDLNKGLADTLIVAHHEIKYNAIVEKRFSAIPQIEAVRGEINQVLLNIVINAVQAIKGKQGEQEGTIILSTRHDEQFVYCTIEDDGAGIEAKDINDIFNPFFTKQPVGQGTGMGLSISYEIIVNRHHGDIMVESCLGKGTKCIVKLPIKHDYQ